MAGDWKIALTGLGLLALGGCASMTQSAEAPSFDQTAWVLTSLAGQAPVATAPTARFEAGRIQGTDGCNRYGGSYTTRGATIEMGQHMAATQMACAPEVMKQAAAYTAALAAARTWRIEGGNLKLVDASGTIVATFAPQAQSLAGTSWLATGINNGKGGVVSLVAGTQVSLSFTADGKLGGSGGCNSFSAGYTSEGAQLGFTPIAATRRMCPVDGVMEQEQAFFKALESVATMRMEGDRLELRTAGGSIAVLARAQKP